MKIQEAQDFFESLKIKTNNTTEIKVYENFLYILKKLKTREFTKDEIKDIEKELENLNLKSNPLNRKKYFKKAQIKFENYLKDKFSLITKNHYTKIGVGLGSSFGILFGIIFLSSLERSMGIAIGLSIGMLIGIIIGINMDTKALKAGKTI
ncbi:MULTISPECIES: hypothetical protein [Flavobacterium]|uniref:Glycine zipper family protein n=1 Tax=Flavobacterium jumunjinense TaxID=998845 RepID=A0ABV5GMT6_9FLAO|nr:MULTISPECIES: hypothetical protein [Flavobacterium]